MATVEPRPPVQPGERAPDFTLPTVPEEGFVSLADYRGKSPVLLAMFRGIYCPFCRRNMAQLALTTGAKLQAEGVETLGIIGSSLEHARRYFRYHPIRLPLAADPEVVTHRAYGLPKPPRTPERIQLLQSVRINPTGELSEPLPLFEASDALDRLEGFVPTEPISSESTRNSSDYSWWTGMGSFAGHISKAVPNTTWPVWASSRRAKNCSPRRRPWGREVVGVLWA